MNLVIKLMEHPALEEFRKNKRLQWMLLVVLAILLTSCLKLLADNLANARAKTKQQTELLARLQSSVEKTVEATKFDEVNKALTNKLMSIPSASSSSTAEAQALTDVEDIVSSAVMRKRLTLLGSETLNNVSGVFWSIRINISGQLAEHDIIDILKYLDGNNPQRRIASFRYSPKTSNSFNMVVDLLYRSDTK